MTEFIADDVKGIVPPIATPINKDETVDVTGVEVTGRTVRIDGGYLLVSSPIPNRPITVRFPLAEEEIELQHRTRRIRVRMRGDEVVAMDNFGADVTFFNGLD